jgi:hypothetical protein
LDENPQLQLAFQPINLSAILCPDVVKTYNYLLMFKAVSSAIEQYKRVFSQGGDVVGSECLILYSATYL